MDRKIAILGDIHANYDALIAVLEDCRSRGVTDFLCTGDVVGYNACPHECLEIVRKELNFGEGACPVVMGNHDYVVSHKEGMNLEDFNDTAVQAIEWTRAQMAVEDIYFLRNLPMTTVKLGLSMVHAPLDFPEKFGYVFDLDQVMAHFVHQMTPICFHGHTHCPMVYSKKLNDFSRTDRLDFSGGDIEIELKVGPKYFVNVGSVGQPRDQDWRAAYAIYEPKTRVLRMCRLEYDLQTAQERIRRAGLPERLASRLAEGR